MSESKTREAVRGDYNFACGYCGVREEEVGSELELDHFQPRSVGGSDEIENLVYCCTTCNRLKGDFRSVLTAEKRVLHPKLDNLSLHLRLENDGLLKALTETGNFHLTRLRLNRPPLVALRRTRAKNIELQEELKRIRDTQWQLREHLIKLDDEIERALQKLTKFQTDK